MGVDPNPDPEIIRKPLRDGSIVPRDAHRTKNENPTSNVPDEGTDVQGIRETCDMRFGQLREFQRAVRNKRSRIR